jgi:hypothetical protein
MRAARPRGALEILKRPARAVSGVGGPTGGDTRGGPMSMTASHFYADYKALKAHLDGASASVELRAAFDRVADAFRTSYTAETFRGALTANAPVPTDLEDRLTSALLLYNRERTIGMSHEVPPSPPGEPDAV